MIALTDHVLSLCLVLLQAVREENQNLKRDVEALRQQASEQVIQKTWNITRHTPMHILSFNALLTVHHVPFFFLLSDYVGVNG